MSEGEQSARLSAHTASWQLNKPGSTNSTDAYTCFLANVYFSNILIPMVAKIRVIYYLSATYFFNGCAYDKIDGVQGGDRSY